MICQLPIGSDVIIWSFQGFFIYIFIFFYPLALALTHTFFILFPCFVHCSQRYTIFNHRNNVITVSVRCFLKISAAGYIPG